MTKQNLTYKLDVGVGATINLHSDRLPATVIKISKSGRKIVLQEDKATRIDNNGMSEIQEYLIERDPEGRHYIATLRKDCSYRIVGSKSTVSIGVRRKFYDFSF